MKINRNMSAVITNNQLKRTENKLAASMERLSSGLKLNHASDNPAGMAISNKMKAQIEALDQAESNASDGISVLQIADGALNEVSSILQRVRELSVQAANGTYSYEDRKSIQAEIDELKKEVDRISSDTEFNTKPLLDGSSDVRVYSNDASRMYVSDAVEAGIYSVNVEEIASQASIELAYPTDVTGNFTLNGVAVDVTAGMSKSEYLEVVRTAAEEAGCVVEEGTTGILVKSQYPGSAEEIEIVISEDLATSLNIKDQCKGQYKEKEFTFQNPVDGSVNINGVDVTLRADMTQTEFEEALAEGARRAGCEYGVKGTELILKSVSSNDVVTVIMSETTANGVGMTDLKAKEYIFEGHGEDAKVTMPSNTDASGFGNTATVRTVGNRVIVTDNGGFELDFLINADYVKAAADPEKGNFDIEVTELGDMTIQIGANEFQTMDVRISEVSSESLYIDRVDVSKVHGAEKAMKQLDEAITKLSATRSRIGAFQNRLEYATSSLAETGENVTAAYSNLTDTDMAEEMTEYTQQNILDQAAVSVLAQANDLPEQVLSLLR